MSWLEVDVNEMIENGSGVAAGAPFAASSQDSAAFRDALTDRTYFTRPIPDSWQGKDILVYTGLSHRVAALTGTGSPPDDQVRLEVGWETLADQVAYDDLGTINDATAPHENDLNLQLGTTQEAVLYQLMATIVTGLTDRFLHMRITRDGGDAGNDGLSGVLHVHSVLILGG